MQINWLIPSDIAPSLYDIDGACQKFFDTYRVNPDTITLSRKHYAMLIMTLPRSLYALEKGKEHGMFIPIITGGMAELVISDEISVTYSNNSHNSQNHSIITVESKKVETAFEKHVLGEQ